MTNRLRMIPEWLLLPLAFAAVKLLLHAISATSYGYFRDELYYIACAKHLAWGYVDHPPLSIFLLALQRGLLGDSLLALRALPALSGAGTIVLTGLIVHRLKGGRIAQAIACLCVLLAPVYLVVDHFFSMNAFDTFLWTLAALLFLRAIETAKPPAWMLLGVVLGLGLLNKWSMMWFAGAAAIGLLVTKHRKQVATPWPWVAAAIAGVLLLPNLLWEVNNSWPTLEFMRNATQGKMIRTGLVDFWAQQLAIIGPGNLLIWLAGLGALLLSRERRPLGVIFVIVAAFLVASGSSRPNYLAVAYPPLFAAGAVAIERLASRPRLGWVPRVALAEIALLGVPLVPLGLPILPVEKHIAYTRALGVGIKAQERTSEGPLPQVFADMFGWQELAERVARVYHALPPDQRAKAAIFTYNYGQAGAIDFFGPRFGLPPAISRHNNYWLWGTHGASGEVLIIVGGSRSDPHSDFRSCVLADTTNCPYCMPYENDSPIFACQGLNKPLSERWLEIKHFD